MGSGEAGREGRCRRDAALEAQAVAHRRRARGWRRAARRGRRRVRALPAHSRTGEHRDRAPVFVLIVVPLVRGLARRRRRAPRAGCAPRRGALRRRHPAARPLRRPGRRTGRRPARRRRW
ncbi:MAG: hypothetical protein FJ137_21855 [Deltaproteobacteria bacterium]|nr:hypothetical protein [Deltaproteobacteria bacterium]